MCSYSQDGYNKFVRNVNNYIFLRPHDVTPLVCHVTSHRWHGQLCRNTKRHRVASMWQFLLRKNWPLEWVVTSRAVLCFARRWPGYPYRPNPEITRIRPVVCGMRSTVSNFVRCVFHGPTAVRGSEPGSWYLGSEHVSGCLVNISKFRTRLCGPESGKQSRVAQCRSVAVFQHNSV
jgi:hypothetical protein